MKNHLTKLLNAGAIGSAIGASICCLGPLVLALSGLGGGALLLIFQPYRSYFLVGTTVLLGASFYLTYRRPRLANCQPDSVCARPSSRTGQKVVLWIVTLLVLLIAGFPYYAEFLP
jgi:mercuric ion transport protein